MVTVNDIYGYIDETAPYSLQESYDNSGLNAGNGASTVSRAVIALDVTKEVAEECARLGAELIITHHPIIFKPLKYVDSSTPLGILLAGGVSAISAHTNFDSAVMNDILCEKLGLEPRGELGEGMGKVCSLKEPLFAKELGEKIKSSLNCGVVRFSDNGKKLSEIAVCSGSGGSLLEDVVSAGCDGFITGDVKHDVFIDAHNRGICIFDAGHFHTENIFCEFIKEKLSARFGEVEFSVAKANGDILSYI